MHLVGILRPELERDPKQKVRRDGAIGVEFQMAMVLTMASGSFCLRVDGWTRHREIDRIRGGSTRGRRDQHARWGEMRVAGRNRHRGKCSGLQKAKHEQRHNWSRGTYRRTFHPD